MMSKLKYLFDLPKTIYFNFRLLPIQKAVKLPFFIGHTYRFSIDDWKSITLNVPEDKIRPFIVRFANGGSVDIIPKQYGMLHIANGGKLVFNGECQFNAGCAIRINGGNLIIGNGVNFNRNCNVSCVNYITIGDESLFGYGSSVRDSDGHSIILDGKKKNNSSQVVIGRHNWICAQAHIGKGVHTGDDCVIGAYSVVTNSFGDKQLIVGIPAKPIQNIDGWIM